MRRFTARNACRVDRQPPGMSYRPAKIASQLSRELGLILAREISDPRLSQVVITQVTVSADLKHARILYGAPGELADLDGLPQAMAKASGYLRFKLARVLRIRMVPDLDFRLDRGYWAGMDVLELISKLERDAKPPRTADADGGD